MSDISQRCSYRLLRLVIVFLWSQSVNSYENAYDLLERSREFANDPRGGVFETSERYYNRDRYSTHNNNPTSVYSSIKPIEDDRRFGINRRSSFSGNGYDNLGNGDQNFRRSSFIDRGNQDSFRDFQRFDDPQRYDRFQESSRIDAYKPIDQFRDSTRAYDRQPFNSFRGTSSRINDPFRGESSNGRSFDSFRDPFRGDSSSSRSFDSYQDGDQFEDRSAIDPIRDSSRFDTVTHTDSTRSIDHFDNGDRIGGGNIRIIDAAPSRGFDDYDYHRRSRPNYEIRGHSPSFYHRDYFSKPVSKSGFETQNSDNKYQSAGGGKENSGLSTVGSFVTSNEDKNQKKTDNAYHDNKEGTKLDIDNSEKVGETTRFDKNGGNKSTVKSNRVSKKGHTTKGFASHHHKDETGNSTTFFDESVDEGGQQDFQDFEDDFGSRKTTELINGKQDGKFFQEVGGRSGNFGSGVLKDNKKVEKDVVANNNRFNNEERFGTGQDHVDRGFKTASEYLGGGVWDDGHHI